MTRISLDDDDVVVDMILSWAVGRELDGCGSLEVGELREPEVCAHSAVLVDARDVRALGAVGAVERGPSLWSSAIEKHLGGVPRCREILGILGPLEKRARACFLRCAGR